MTAPAHDAVMAQRAANRATLLNLSNAERETFTIELLQQIRANTQRCATILTIWIVLALLGGILAACLVLTSSSGL